MTCAERDGVNLFDLGATLWAECGRHGQGVTFNCPLCVRAGFERPGLVSVAFANPIDGGAPLGPHVDEHGKVVGQRFLWQRTGTSIEDLTLSPSLDASRSEHVDRVGRGGRHAGWHGHVQNGWAVGGGA